MLYSVTKQNGKFAVIENATMLCMRTFEKSFEAYAFCKKLNAGNGFQGWTPEFFIKNNGNINT